MTHIPIVREDRAMATLRPRPFKEVYSLFDVSRAK
jgi:hypothetical protein